MLQRIALTGLLVFFSFGSLWANPRTLGDLSRKADRVEEKRVEKQLWSGPQRSNLQDKSFPIEEWSMHYSSLGSKRAPIAVNESSDKKKFRADRIEKKEVAIELSRWNERMADLHDQAGISMDDEARITADRKLYHMMLQDTQAYADLGEELSLRELNKYQFRRNRPEGAVPVQAAGQQ